MAIDINALFENLPTAQELIENPDNVDLENLLGHRDQLNQKIKDEENPVLKTEWIKQADYLNQNMVSLKNSLQKTYSAMSQPTNRITSLVKNLNKLNQKLSWDYDIPKFNDERRAYLDSLAQLTGLNEINDNWLSNVKQRVEQTLIIRNLLENYENKSIAEQTRINEEIKRILSLGSIDIDQIRQKIEQDKLLCSTYMYYEDFENLAKSDIEQTFLPIDLNTVASIQYDSSRLNEPSESFNPTNQIVGRKGIACPLNSVVTVQFKDDSSLDFGPQGSVYLPVPSQELFNKPSTVDYQEFLKKEDHFIDYLLARYENDKKTNPNASISLNLDAIAGDSFRESYRDRLVQKLFERYGEKSSQKESFRQHAFELNAALVRGGVLMESEGYQIMDKAKRPSEKSHRQSLRKEAIKEFMNDMSNRLQDEKIKPNMIDYLESQEKKSFGQSMITFAKEQANIVSYAAFSTGQFLYNIGSYLNSGTTVDLAGSYGNIFGQAGINENIRERFLQRLYKLMKSNHADLDKELSSIVADSGLDMQEAKLFIQQFKQYYNEIGFEARELHDYENKQERWSNRVSRFLSNKGRSPAQSNSDDNNPPVELGSMRPN